MFHSATVTPEPWSGGLPHKVPEMLLQIWWHQFIRDNEIATTTGRLSISETISRHRNALFGHVARLPYDAPADKALNCQVNLSLGRPPNSQWHRHPSCPHNRWVDQIRNDNNLPPADLSGGSVVVTAEWCYGPCWLSNDNNNCNCMLHRAECKLRSSQTLRIDGSSAINTQNTQLRGSERLECFADLLRQLSCWRHHQHLVNENIMTSDIN